MKTLTLSSLSILLLLAVVAVPAAAAPWCANYCSCSSHCWTQCYDEGGASACDAYICDEFCFESKAVTTASAENLFASELFSAPTEMLTPKACDETVEDLEITATE